MDNISKRIGAYLPHWSKDGSIYFVTFRLIDSLPKKVISELATQRGDMLDGSEPFDLKAIQRLDKLLDKGFGPDWLKNPDIARLIVSAIRHFDGERYELHAYCVMPNHVHVVLKPQNGVELAGIIRSMKNFPARRANHILGREGAFWSREYFDRLIRTSKEHTKSIEYVWFNPESAGIENSPWKWRLGESHPVEK